MKRGVYIDDILLIKTKDVRLCDKNKVYSSPSHRSQITTCLAWLALRAGFPVRSALLRS